MANKNLMWVMLVARYVPHVGAWYEKQMISYEITNNGKLGG
jgi:hypothetical protein